MPPAKQRLTPRAFLDAKTPHSPSLSPDGRRVVFVVNEADYHESRWVGRLWLAEVPAGRARRITASYEGERDPQWSPDGRHIAFLSARPDMTEPPPDQEDDEDLHKEQIWVLPVDGGEAFRLTNTQEGVRAFGWAPDGKTILYLAPEARPRPIQFIRDDNRKRRVDPVVEHKEKLRQQFWGVDLEEKRPELLFTGDYGLAEFDVSPDGRYLVFNTNHSGEANDYYQYDLFVLDLEEEGEPRKLVERGGGKFQPAWSPDGRSIAFLSNLDPSLSYSQECVWLVPLEGGEPRNLFADAPYDCHQICWPRQGSLYGIVADREEGPLARISENDVRPITRGCCVDDFDVSDGPEQVMVVVAEDAQSLPELYLVEPDGSRHALTELNANFGEQYHLPRQEVVRWSSADGMQIEGLVLFPPGYEPGTRLPLVVQVHGGPKGRVTNTLRGYHMPAVYAAEGYLVFRPNFRGSEGYGNAFAVANRRDLGGGDFRDIMTGVEYLVDLGLADAERMGIMGGSYGGYMTNWAIGQTDRFKAAVSEFGIFNLVTDFSNSEISRWDPDYMGAYYWEDPDVYRRCSPATFLERMSTPVLILHGDSDNNTFIANSKEMYQALRARGVTVEFVHYPREGHGLREPNHKLDEMRRCLAWFDRFLKGDGTKPHWYRAGDRIEHDGYVLIVSRAEDGEYANWHEDWGRLLEVDFSIASEEPVESAWRFELAEAVLDGPDGPRELKGVPVDGSGTRVLVSGEGLAADIHPDKETGRISLGMAATYDIPAEGGAFTLRIGDFPPVAVVIGPREPKEGEEGATAEPETESAASVTMPGEETPIQTPERPDKVTG